jgi:hypothetical protein
LRSDRTGQQQDQATEEAREVNGAVAETLRRKSSGKPRILPEERFLDGLELALLVL